ncbi:hypothetical protein ABEF92_002602 [Exophiala dermatitidis]|uniref:Uncharacterized protein n=1 Tax=Exophiala dermatitidis (strain ATCC 34100 / CBS 525.76 / NIH/UT8656) TaxID=858893 RepID=H6CA67_EXODN|nr:uncharacterized protein HMPREF1120_08004 [Exophiala dermatitidis NIH/UT8656]EHY60031.1 hypothetical protein HMPREF1120_08004 [Exophiala dermatitidis NIH/UT8656]
MGAAGKLSPIATIPIADLVLFGAACSLIFFLIFLALIFSIIGWVIYTQVYSQRQGLPAPSLRSWKTYVPFVKTHGSSNYPAPRHASPLEWIRDQFSRLTNRRTARGAYEEAGGDTGYGGGRRGRGGVEDDAWDTRVGGDDPYASGPGGYGGYEEQELGLASTPGLHHGGSGGDYLGTAGRGEYGYEEAADNNRRGRSRDQLDQDPFGDQNEEPSLRSVSPRPETDLPKGHTKGSQSLDTQGSGDGGSSPTSTRKSVFREGI